MVSPVYGWESAFLLFAKNLMHGWIHTSKTNTDGRWSDGKTELYVFRSGRSSASIRTDTTRMDTHAWLSDTASRRKWEGQENSNTVWCFQAVFRGTSDAECWTDVVIIDYERMGFPASREAARSRRTVYSQVSCAWRHTRKLKHRQRREREYASLLSCWMYGRGDRCHRW